VENWAEILAETGSFQWYWCISTLDLSFPKDSLGQSSVMLISSIAPKLPHHPNFTVVDILAAADFGWEYLVQDATGLWVLEEFLLSAETPADLRSLQTALTDQLAAFAPIAHPQLAQSRSVLVFDDRLFWQREYIPGHTYQQLLETAIGQDAVFTEDAVWDLLLDVLEPLAQLHDRGLAHGAIDRNAVVCREADGAIVLQRFGGIRDFGLAHRFYPLHPLVEPTGATHGITQDLADLANLALVLLVGDDPLDAATAVLSELQQEAIISDEFAGILTQMLTPKPWRQFRDAREVLQALQTDDLANDLADDDLADDALADRVSPSPTKFPGRDPIIITLAIVFIGLVGLSLWRVVNMTRSQPTASENPPNIGKFSGKSAPQKIAGVASHSTPTKSPSPKSPEKQGIPIELYDRLTTELSTTEKTPTPPIDATLNQLSEEARRELGTYNRRSYDRWFATLTARKISQPTVDILADTAFYLRFPALKTKTLNPRTFGQIWYAIARDQITDLNQQKNLKVITTNNFNESSQLQNGQGRVFQVQLKPGDRLQLSLEAHKQDVRLSVIENEIILTRGSLNTRWTAPPSSRSATYEVILTPLKLDAVAYNLRLQP
jgi:serine/threonine protein kinase, bacterial